MTKQKNNRKKKGQDSSSNKTKRKKDKENATFTESIVLQKLEEEAAVQRRSPPLNILIAAPNLLYSHFALNAKIAGELSKAGHNVVGGRHWYILYVEEKVDVEEIFYVYVTLLYVYVYVAGT
jgi:hypothetical protein